MNQPLQPGQLKALNNAVALIAGVGCAFKIITPDGEEFGDLIVQMPKQKKPRAPLQYKKGTIRGSYRDKIDLDMPIGKYANIDCGEYPIKTVYSNVCAYLSANWGRESYTITTIGDKVLQVTRIAIN